MKETQHIEWKTSWRDEHNPLLAGAFFRSGDIESWGRGIDKIRTACRENGSQFPVFHADLTSMTVEFSGVVPGDITPTDQPGLADGLVDGLVDSQRTIIGLVRQNPDISKREMAELIGISTTAIDKNIVALKKLGLLARVGSAKSGHWEVRNPA